MKENLLKGGETSCVLELEIERLVEKEAAKREKFSKRNGEFERKKSGRKVSVAKSRRRSLLTREVVVRKSLYQRGRSEEKDPSSLL